jgi:hypothetical protein
MYSHGHHKTLRLELLKWRSLAEITNSSKLFPLNVCVCRGMNGANSSLVKLPVWNKDASGSINRDSTRVKLLLKKDQNHVCKHKCKHKITTPYG